MNETISQIKEAQSAKDLHAAGDKMRSFLQDCDDKEVRDRILSVWQSKSVRMINPKHLSRNF